VDGNVALIRLLGTGNREQGDRQDDRHQQESHGRRMPSRTARDKGGLAAGGQILPIIDLPRLNKAIGIKIPSYEPSQRPARAARRKGGL